MQLYKYVYCDQQITSSILEVKQNKSNYSFLSNPHKRIPKEQLNKVFHSDSEGLVLYLDHESFKTASDFFAHNLLNQAEAYLHVADCLQKDVENLVNLMKGCI